MQILGVEAFLETRVVLLDSVAVFGIVQEKSEVGKQIEERPAHEPVGFEAIAGVEYLPVVNTAGSEAHAAAVVRVDVSKPRQFPAGNKVQRDLSGRIKIIASEVQFEADRLTGVEMPGVVPGNVVTLVSQWILEWAVGS